MIKEHRKLRHCAVRLAILAWVCCATSTTRAVETIPLAPVAGESSQKSLGLYAEPCDVDVECVAVIVSCDESSFEITLTLFNNSEVADWLTHETTLDSISHGDVTLSIDGKIYPLYPSQMNFSDFSGWWEVTLTATDDQLGRSLWEVIPISTHWVARLAPHEQAFVIDQRARQALVGTAAACRDR